MSLATPITNGTMSAGALAFQGAGPGYAAEAPPAGASAAAAQGTGNLAGPHNTPLHVGGILLFAGGVIFALHYLGFRFAADVGLGRG